MPQEKEDKPKTLGDLVHAAHVKNKKMNADDKRTLLNTLRQRGLWQRLQQTFFAPGADPDKLSEMPVHEFSDSSPRVK